MLLPIWYRSVSYFDPLYSVAAASDMIRNDKVAELLEQRRSMDLKQLNKVPQFAMHPTQCHSVVWRALRMSLFGGLGQECGTVFYSYVCTWYLCGMCVCVRLITGNLAQTRLLHCSSMEEFGRLLHLIDREPVIASTVIDTDVPQSVCSVEFWLAITVLISAHLWTPHVVCSRGPVSLAACITWYCTGVTPSASMPLSSVYVQSCIRRHVVCRVAHSM